MSQDEHPLVPEGHEARREFEEAEGIHPDTPPPIGFPEGDGEPMVWLAHPAEDLRRNHGMVVLSRGEQLQAFEIAKWTEEKPIDRLFSIAGYAPPKGPPALHGMVDVDVQSLVPVMGFKVPASMLGGIASRIQEAMTGQTGGFSSLSLGQLGFHQAHTAFMAAWQASGRPPVHVRQPQWVDVGAGTGAPLPLAHALEKHLGHGASLGYWEGQRLFDDEPVEGEAS